MITIVMILFLVAALLVLAGCLIYAFVHRSKLNEVGKEFNQSAIGRTEVRIEIQEVVNRFYDHMVDRFLRENIGHVKRWLPVYEDKIGLKPEGTHIIRVWLQDGSSREVRVDISKISLSLGSKEQKNQKTEAEEPAEVSIDQIVGEWLAKWSPKMEEFAERCEGFSIPDEDLPKEHEAKTRIASCVTRQGFFNCQYDEENTCLRLAYVGLD